MSQIFHTSSLRIVMTLIITCHLTACSKYLEKIPDRSLATTNTVQGFQELLDNDLLTNTSSPGLGQLGTDDYIISYSTWQAADPISRNAYIWATDVYQGQTVLAWNNPYTAIYYSNVALSGLDTITVHDSAARAAYDAVKGSALFYRSFLFYALEETFGQPYRPGTAGSDLGILLRLTPDPDQHVGRSSVQRVFQQIIQDLKQAAPLLPVSVQTTYPNRPCRPAVFAMLARTYLTMQDYANAKIYADSCLQLYAELIDYNTLNAASSRPFLIDKNKEVLFQCSSVAYATQYSFTSTIDTTLYNSYDSNDLRKQLFFRPTSRQDAEYFKGQYTGRIYLFSGLSTDEVVLIAAETNARLGDKETALRDLNRLLSLRWKSNTFHPYTVQTTEQALDLVLIERRKETLFRELRWSDLRRLNQDPRYAITLKRVINDTVYTLPPNAPKYTYPIPDYEIRLSDIPQNQRTP